MKETVEIEEFESIVCEHKMEIVKSFVETHKIGEIFINHLTNTNDYVKLLEFFVECGSDDAMFALGTIYEFGEEIEQNYDKAIKYYKMASEKGHCNAMCYLGHMYGNGDGVERNYEEAIKYYVKAIKTNDTTDSYFYLSNIIEELNRESDIFKKCSCHKVLRDIGNDFDYLKKIECSMDDVLLLYDENDALRKELAELKEHVKYMPYGEGYEEAKVEFEQLATQKN